MTYLGFVCTDDAEKDRKSLEFSVHEKEDELEAGERYAIVGTPMRLDLDHQRDPLSFDLP